MAFREVKFRNFSGGLNSRDHPSELSENEFPNGSNITIDERGGLRKRLGYVDRFGVQIAASLVSNIFYWAINDQVVSQVGTTMHVNSGAAFHTWSTSARCGMCEFQGNLVMIHPIDGMKVYNGVSVSTPTNAPVGNVCATWQNRVWTAGEPSSPPRVRYTDIGSTNTTTPSTQFVDIREKDSALITCLGGASGLDISGRPGLLVFKADSSYRIHDSSTGAYTTIDTAIGCGSNIGSVNAYGRTFVISSRGIYSTDGLEPMREDSQLIEDFFHKDVINQNRADLYCAGRFQDRLRFSVPGVGLTANNLAVELHPIQGWICRHTDAASAYATIGRNSTDLVMGSPSVNGRIYNAYSGFSDNGTAIASSFQTKWQEPAGGYKARIRRARFVGNGAFSATLFKDYDTAQSLRTLAVAIESDAAIYDAGQDYNEGHLYGPTKFQNIQDFYSIGVARAIAINISETSSLEPWKLSHVSMLCIDLGYT